MNKNDHLLKVKVIIELQQIQSSLRIISNLTGSLDNDLEFKRYFKNTRIPAMIAYIETVEANAKQIDIREPVKILTNENEAV
jgi:hypothetical protein